MSNKTGSQSLMDNDTQNLIKVQVLLNAKLYKGKPNEKAILGKLLGKHAELRSQAVEVKTLITEIFEESGLTITHLSTEYTKNKGHSISIKVNCRKNECNDAIDKLTSSEDIVKIRLR